jgi:hypothetical protein
MLTLSTQFVNCDILYSDAFTFPTSLFLYFICCSLHDLRDKGALKRLRIQWWEPQLSEVKSPWNMVDFNSVMPILVVLAVGVIMASILLVIERKWHQYQHAELYELQH